MLDLTLTEAGIVLFIFFLVLAARWMPQFGEWLGDRLDRSARSDAAPAAAVPPARSEQRPASAPEPGPVERSRERGADGPAPRSGSGKLPS